MKRYIRNNSISAGIRPDTDGHYVFDYTYNLPSDIIHIQPPQLYKSIEGNNVYWFGYMFNDDVSSKDRTSFINYLKGIGDDKISASDLKHLIELPLDELNNNINLYHIDCFVYPLSNRSELVSTMVKTINRWTSREMDRLSFELVKSAPKDIGFDWKSFSSDYERDPLRYKQMSKYIEDKLLPKIHQLDYFSLAHNVKPKYRPYIQNFLKMSESDIEILSRLQGDNILVVDDINTSGSTIQEIIRIISSVNSNCNIYIYTLIGNVK